MGFVGTGVGNGVGTSVGAGDGEGVTIVIADTASMTNVQSVHELLPWYIPKARFAVREYDTAGTVTKY